MNFSILFRIFSAYFLCAALTHSLSAEENAIRGTLKSVDGIPVTISGCSSNSGNLVVEAEQKGGTASIVGFQEFAGHVSSPPKRFLKYSRSGKVTKCDFGSRNSGCESGSANADYEQFNFTHSSGSSAQVNFTSQTRVGDASFKVFFNASATRGSGVSFDTYALNTPGSGRIVITEAEGNITKTASGSFYVQRGKSFDFSVTVYNDGSTDWAEKRYYANHWTIGGGASFQGSASVDPLTGQVTKNQFIKTPFTIDEASCGEGTPGTPSDLPVPSLASPITIPAHNSDYETKNVTNTEVSITRSGDCVAVLDSSGLTPKNVYFSYNGGRSYTLSDEDTEEDAFGRLRSQSAWSPVNDHLSLTSAYQERSSGVSFTYREGRFRLIQNGLSSGQYYSADIYYASRPYGSGTFVEDGQAQTVRLSGSGDGSSPVQSSWINLPVRKGMEYKISRISGRITENAASKSYYADFGSGCGDYKVTFNIDKTPCDGGPTETTTKEVFVSLENGGSTPEQQLEGIEGYTLTVDPVAWAVPLSGCSGCSSDGSDHGLGGGPRNGCVDWNVPLGEDASGDYYGVFRLYSEQIVAGLDLADTLQFISGGAFAEQLQVSGNSRRQVRTDHLVADLQPVSGGGYTLDFYRDAAVDTKVNGYYTFTGSHYLRWTVEQSTSDTLSITRDYGGQTRDYEYTQTNTANGGHILKLETGSGLRNESKETAIDANDSTIKTVTTTLTNAASIVQEKTTETFRTYSWGTVRTSEVRDPDGEALTTTWSYDTSAISPSLGQILLQTNPDGTTEHSTYDAVTGDLLEMQYKAPDQSILSTSTYRRVFTDFDTDGSTDQLVIENRISLRESGSRTYRLESGTRIQDGDQSYRQIEMQRPLAVAADTLTGDFTTWSFAWDDTGNQTTLQRVHADGEFLGQIAWQLNPDGTLETWERSLDFATKEVTTIHSRGEADTNQAAVIAGYQTTSIVSPGGTQLLREVKDIATDVLIEETRVVITDAAGRPEMTVYHDGTYETRQYACCGLDSMTDRQGLTTAYLYDSLGRVEDVTRAQGSSAQQVTRNIYDSAGNITQVWEGPDSSSLSLESEYEYNLAGQQIHMRDRFLDSAPSGARQTSTVRAFQANGNETVTTTYPNGSTRIEERYPEGNIYQVTGTALRGMRYAYATELDATLGYSVYTQSTTRLDETNTLTPEYTKSYQDALGRTYKTEHLDASSATATTVNTYNSLGQMASTQDPDGQSTLYAYDAQGRLEVTALDVNGNSIIDYSGTDRITRQKTIYTTRDELGTTYPVQRTTIEAWETDSSSTPIEISRVESTLGAQPSITWSERYGLTTTTTTTLDASTRTLTNETLYPDNSRSESITTDGRLSQQSRYHSNSDILSRQEYAYDSDGRVDFVTDYFDGVTDYTYFDDGQLKSMTTPDPDPAQTGLGFDPQTTAYTYLDTLAEISRTTTLPDLTTSKEMYSPTGELKSVSGSQTYPASYTYDYAGRLRSQSTWQDEATGSPTLTAWEYFSNGQLKQKWYDASIDPSGTISGSAGPAYTYSSAGRLASKANARGTLSTYTYAANSYDLMSITHDDTYTAPVSYGSYDRLGRPVSITDASGTRTITYAEGQGLDEIYTAGTFADYTIDRELDTLNRIASLSLQRLTTSLHAVDYSYDGASRLETVTHGSQTFTYSYDPSAELRQTVTFNNGVEDIQRAESRRDALGRLKSLTTVNLLQSDSGYAYQYNDLNQRTRTTRTDDNSYWQYAYDARGQLQSAQRQDASDASIPGYDYGYSFDDIGNRTQTTTNGRAADYTVDALNQYDARDVPRTLDIRGSALTTSTVTVNGQTPTRSGEYFYHDLDLSAQGAGAQFKEVTVTASLPDGGDNNTARIADSSKSEYLPSDPEAYTHDLDGNLLTDGQWQYTWDANNRLIEMETLAVAYTAGASRQKLEFAYDSQGRRFSKKVSKWDATSSTYEKSVNYLYLYDGWNLIAELESILTPNFTLHAAYVWGLDFSGTMQGAGGVGGLLAVTSSASTAYPSYDGNGNVMGYYDASSGTSVAEFEYGPFGELIKETGSKKDDFNFRFSTKYQDAETGLLYYGFRYYDAETGRWLNRDPIGEAGGLNLYGMVGNDAINYVDALGLLPIAQAEAIALESCENECDRVGEIRNAALESIVHSPLGQKPGANAARMDAMISSINKVELASTVGSIATGGAKAVATKPFNVKTSTLDTALGGAASTAGDGSFDSRINPGMSGKAVGFGVPLFEGFAMRAGVRVTVMIAYEECRKVGFLKRKRYVKDSHTAFEEYDSDEIYGVGISRKIRRFAERQLSLVNSGGR